MKTVDLIILKKSAGSSSILKLASKVSERLEEKEVEGSAYLNNYLVKAVEPSNVTSTLKSLIK